MNDALEEWRLRVSAFVASAPPPRWERGIVVDQRIRDHYDRFLPIEEYLPVLRRELLRVLPETYWLPQILGEGGGLRSVCDLWALLPDKWAHRLVWEAPCDWWAVACVLASPVRFGTRAGRYPEQRQLISEGCFSRILDLGSGTGQGTWELAQLSSEARAVVGVTLEPLEAWMATNRELPHLELAGEAAGYPAEVALTPRFVSADARKYDAAESYDLIVCNGLAGGPALRTEVDLRSLWRVVDRAAASSCTCVVGNHFHDGYAGANSRFAALAPSGWSVTLRTADTIVMVRSAV